jgi:capsular polysaccharide biosynthesis protein
LQNQQINTQYIQEDEIDLRELFHTIMKRKKFIIIFTSIVTILALIWAFTRTPIYEAKAIVKIGEYKIANNNIVLENGSSLVTELKVLFIDIFKNDKNKITIVQDIKILKGQKQFISITTQSTDNKKATNEINKIVKYIQDKHQNILSDIKEQREQTINNIKQQINIITSRELPQLNKKISTYTKDMNIYTKSLERLLKSLNKLKDKSPTLTVLELNEQRHLTEIKFQLRQDITEAEDKKFTLQNTTLEGLKRKIENIQTLLKPYNYKNTQIVGNIITNDYPIKPKKKLIVIVAFVTGLILSIFLVFFLEFIKNKEDDK